MRYFILMMFAMALISCADMPEEKRAAEGAESSNGTAVPPAGTGSVLPDAGLLRFSTRQPNTGSAAEGNLCKVPFDDTNPLFPVTDNPDGRYFEMNDTGGVYVIMITAGNTRSTFMLEPRGNHVALLTSVQAPECLSRKANFFMNENGAGFAYDGDKYIKYHLSVSKTGKGFRGDMTWDHGREMGLRVRYKKKID